MKLDYKISKALNTQNLIIVSLYNFISIYSSLVVGLLIVIFFDKSPTKAYIKLLIILAIIVILLKFLLKRKRPYIKYPDIYNRDFLENRKDGSFPSMHTMSITVVSYMLFRQYNIPLVFPIFPIFTIISRVGLGVHYISDCLITFIVTILINFIFYL